MHLERMDTQPVSLLPKGFDYYAGGHVHHRMEFSASEYKKVTQPGALFPNNFAELEKYGNGGFFIVHNDVVEWKAVNVRERIALTYDVDGKKADDVSKELLDMMKTVKADTLVTLRVYGKLSSGQVSDITFNDVMAEGYARGAYVVLKNTAALSGKEFQEVDVQADSIEQIEEQLKDLPALFKKDLSMKKEMYETVPSGECPSGTRGRIAVFEMFKIDKEMQSVILKDPTDGAIYKSARNKGMLMMREDAMLKALDGVIPFTEVYNFNNEKE